ncbi:MAG TPA: FG-GAP-like repeat-containing protein [Candidatus Krumholzibacteria bacterium]|nr:FG-GAP-like repeat-containing protein [Candidatus Krumholzibacteria bacterium]
MKPAPWLLLILALPAAALAAPPQVVSVQPARQRVDAPANGVIEVQFDADIDPSTVDAVSFRVFGRWSGPASGARQVVAGLITFIPDDPFFAGEYVTVSMSRAIENTLGEAMAFGHAWSFWVETAPASLDLDFVTRYDVRQSGETWVQPYGAYAGDLDNDGWSDLFVPCEQSDDVRIYMNNGAGLYPGGFTITKPTNMNTPSPNEGADFDNDGEIDVVVTNVSSDRVIVMFGDGSGAFPTSVGLLAGATQVRGVGVLDLNGDGLDDIVTASRVLNKTSIFINNGARTFAARVDIEAGVEAETSIAVADANNDGILDVFLGNYNIPRNVTVLLGNGNGGLVAQTPVPTSGQPWMLAAGDLNGDGDVDVFSANSSGNGIGVHYGNGAGGISAVSSLATGGFPLAIDAGDIDGDGDLELVSSDYGSGSWTVWENNGAGGFVDPRSLAASSAGSCATLHDRDNDGDLDLTGLDEVDDWVYLFANDSSAASAPRTPGAAVTMEQNHPNPFNPSTTIRFTLAGEVFVTLTVYDATGAFVVTLANARYAAGPHDVRWNGTDASGRRVASGLYFYRLNAAGSELSRKMTLLK